MTGAVAARAARITVPDHRHKLKAFAGPYAAERAYLAGRFYAATIFNREHDQAFCRQHGIDTSYHGALTESANELGGFVVPAEIETAIIDLRERYGVLSECGEVPMSSDTKSISRRTGGVTAYFGGESQAMTESTKTWGQVNLIAKKLYALTRYSNEIGEDAYISIGDDLTKEIAYAFAVKEDGCLFNGDGTSAFGGMVGITNKLQAGSIVTAATGHVGFDTLTIVDCETAIGALAEYADDGDAKWFVSRAGYGAMMLRLMSAAGGNTVATLQNGTRERMFLGYPVVISQALNRTFGSDPSQTKAYFGNLKLGVAVGRRRGMSIVKSDQRFFETDEIAIRGTERFDLTVVDPGTSTTAGSIVALQTSAS